ncbi:MAG: hypothetical protein ACLP4W_08765 [Mycobacterium sp.]|uniref:hypothetical protein n=1 Tax=Mycobacterium sp. TaxID=1785 RepID=UPI003F9C752A
MAIQKDSYYTGEGPEIPTAGNDYQHPTPHSAVADQRPFTAPTGGFTQAPPAAHAGFDGLADMTAHADNARETTFDN